MKKLMALMALTVLTACDYVNRADFDRERADKSYKSAMDDYRAGRMDEAVKGFELAVRKDPSNASARFQLACLLQDVKADYLGAFCGYREYLSQHPESDKARMVADRLAKCERELAKMLADKYGLSEKGGLVKENEALKKDLRSAEVRVATLEKEAESLRARVTALGAERERLLAIVKGEEVSAETLAARKPSVTEAGASAETFVMQKPSVKEAKELLEEDDGIDRIKMSADAAALRVESADELSSGSSLLPVNAKTGGVVRAAKPAEPSQKPVRQIPETYVVQEGDTLYGLSKRFYGRLSVWKRIRDMNKELISSDNRLHAGDTLRLPRE